MKQLAEIFSSREMGLIQEAIKYRIEKINEMNDAYLLKDKSEKTSDSEVQAYIRTNKKKDLQLILPKIYKLKEYIETLEHLERLEK